MAEENAEPKVEEKGEEPVKNKKSKKTTYSTREELDKGLIKEMNNLSKEVGNLKRLEFVKILKHPWKFLWLSFLKGLMVGFGSVLGASVLVAIFVYIIAQISLVPILGDFVDDLFSEINIQDKLNEQVVNNSEILDQYSDALDQIENPETTGQTEPINR